MTTQHRNMIHGNSNPVGLQLPKGCNSRRNQCTYIQSTGMSKFHWHCMYTHTTAWRSSRRLTPKNIPISYHVTTYSTRKKGFFPFWCGLSLRFSFYSQTSHRIRKLFSIQAQGNSTIPRLNEKMATLENNCCFRCFFLKNEINKM